jgi:hypothetical protein
MVQILINNAGARRSRSSKPGAIRMSRLLHRRRRGFRCCVVEYSARDLDALVARGFLDRLNRDDQTAIERAIGAVLDQL